MSITLPPDYGLAAFDDIDSTNEEAKRRADEGERGPLWLLAKRQTAGRGRRGRAWESLVGNLLTTLLIAPESSAADAARLSFAAALAVHDLVQAICPNVRVQLKWPNDVLIEGRKCAGILLEFAGEKNGVLPWIAVGIGVNLAHKPDNTPYPAAALAEFAAIVSPERALEILSRAWDIWFRLWRADGFQPLRQAWLDRACGLGQTVTARLAQDTYSGVFENLGTDGSLQLRLADKTLKAISSGEVFFGEP